LRAIEIWDETDVAGAWFAGSNTGGLDILIRINGKALKDVGPPLMDEHSYVWPDPNLKPIMVDFSKAGKGIMISTPAETLQDWM
jgi:hypothetical protein